MSLSVIGAGFGRTGTLSMKGALERLGFGPCHHMLEVFPRPETVPQWAAAIRGEDVDLDGLVAGFSSTVDFPSCVVWDRLARRNPDAKIVLSVRPSEDWWRSFAATIGPRLGATDDTATELTRAIRDHVFGGRTDDRDAAIRAYEAHNGDVITRAGGDRLLIYEVGSGWGPLSEFLEVPVPADPFPSVNTTEEFQAMVASIGDTPPPS